VRLKTMIAMELFDVQERWKMKDFEVNLKSTGK